MRAAAVALAGVSTLTACGADTKADPCSFLTPAEAGRIVHAHPLAAKPYLSKGDETSNPDLAHDGIVEENDCSYGPLKPISVGVGVMTFSSERKARAYVADDLQAKRSGYLRVSPSAAINEQIAGFLVGTAIHDRRVFSITASDGRHLDADGVATPDFDYDLYRQLFARAIKDF